jgi:hypothetical protein
LRRRLTALLRLLGGRRLRAFGLLSALLGRRLRGLRGLLLLLLTLLRLTGPLRAALRLLALVLVAVGVRRLLLRSLREADAAVIARWRDGRLQQDDGGKDGTDEKTTFHAGSL